MGNEKALKVKLVELQELHKDSDKDALAEKQMQLEAPNAREEKLRTDLEASNKDVEELKAALKSSKDNAEKLKADLEASNKDVEELNAQLAEFESGKKQAPKHPSVKIDKKDYLVTRAIQIKDQKFSARQIAENAEVVDGKKIANWLLEKGSGVLKLKTPVA